MGAWVGVVRRARGAASSKGTPDPHPHLPKRRAGGGEREKAKAVRSFALMTDKEGI